MTQITTVDAETLSERLRERGYQPARADAEALWQVVADGTREHAELAARALERLGAEAGDEAMRRFEAAVAPERARLCDLVCCFVGERWPGHEARLDFVRRALADADPKTRRNAIIALGKLPAPAHEAALLQAWRDEHDAAVRRSLATSLGKIGGPDALTALDAVPADEADAELRRIVAEARLKLRRTLGRGESAGRVRAELPPPRAIIVHLHTRIGVAPILAEEAAARGFSARILDESTCAVTLEGQPLSSLYALRTFLRFGFPLPPATVATPLLGEVADQVVARLAAPEIGALLQHYTEGAPRFRLEWADAGHRRGLTFRVAAELERRAPALQNDPTASLWEVVVREAPSLAVDVWPRGLPDPRFDYRRHHVPASSHPTLAAALAWVGGVRDDDVVWDPFVGAGTELVERARLGPARRFLGSDRDAAVLPLARDNLLAANVAADLRTGDATQLAPTPPPTLIITNPPMGRRVLDRHQTGDLYRSFLRNVARVLAPDGRLVWITPRPRETDAYARDAGLHVAVRYRVDMAGFWGELQRLTRATRPSAAGARAPRRRT